jgi:aromatic ring-opening dioxygenase LigB subunit
VLVSAYMLPHGSQIIPGLDDNYDEANRPLHQAMQQMGAALAADCPDAVILVTPHGISLPEHHAVYMHDRLMGLLYALAGPHDINKVKEQYLWTGDSALARRLLGAMLDRGIPTLPLVQGSSEYPLALAWGETVPLYYLLRDCSPRVVIISLPRSRLDRLGDIQVDLAALGAVLYEQAMAFGGRVSLVMSADQSHTHDAAGPYGFHESAKAFDELVQQWVTAPTRDRLNGLLALQPTAKACAMAGMCSLQVVLERSALRSAGAVYAAPTYFGMLAARWD